MESLWSEYSSLVVLCLINAGITYSTYLMMVCGRLSLAPVGFMALGAYGSTFLTTRGYPVGFGLIVGTALATVVAVGFGLIVLRLRSAYFTVATLAFVLVVSQLAATLSSVTGGGLGMTGVPAVVGVGAAGAFVVIVAAVMASVDRGRTGRAIRTIGVDDRIAAALGIDSQRYLLGAFVASGCIAGLGGGLYAHTLPFIDPTLFGFGPILDFLAFAVLGGTAAWYGPILGAVLLTAAPTAFGSLGSSRGILIGAVLLLVVIVAPRGLAGIVSRDGNRRLRRAIGRRFRRPPPALAEGIPRSGAQSR